MDKIIPIKETKEIILESTRNNYSHNLKLLDLDNDSIIFYNKESPIISSNSIKGLVSQDKFIELYSFNPKKSNFNNIFSIDSVKKYITKNIIDYSNVNDIKENLTISLHTNEITKYFIYFLFFLLFLEMILSNARPAKSN